MKCDNKIKGRYNTKGIDILKETDKKLKAREFCTKVKELADEYNLPFFVVTDGASATSNNDCLAVKNARENHIKWKKENGFDPYEDWSKNNNDIKNNCEKLRI